MVVNPAGLQIIADGGIPQTITGYAAEVISGGEFVQTSGADVVSSGLGDFATTDIVFNTDASGAACVGIAAMNVESGAPVTVYTKGMFLVTASADVTVSQGVVVDGANSGEHGVTAGNVVGQAITGATSGNYFILKLNL